MSGLHWTEERTELCIKLWKQGRSGAEIGRELGITRNAVIGKINRMNYVGRRKSVPSSTRNDYGKAQPKPKPDPKHRTGFNGFTRKKPPILPDLTMTVPLEAPEPLKLVLEELTNRNCKWPIGDPAGEDFHFCGHMVNGSPPYCPFHRKLAYQPRSAALEAAE